MEQTFFNYNLEGRFSINDFYVSSSNQEAYEYIINDKVLNNNIFLYGPAKSGKTHLGLIWKNKFKAIMYNYNVEEILNQKRNIIIDNFLNNINEENIFHILNHCKSFNLKILITSNINLSEYKFKFNDLLSRLKTFYLLKINMPDDDLIINLLIKLLHDKQIIINNPEIFQFILKRIQRSFNDIFLLVENIDKLSLEKKRELTIPLIKELL